MIEFARLIPESIQLTIFTVSPLVALELNEHPNANVILIGGQLSKNSQISIGAHPISILHDIKADLCFLGTNGLCASNGVTDSDWEVVQVKKAMINAAAKSVILSISEKLDSVQSIRVCEIDKISAIITELPSSHESLQSYPGLSLVN